MSLSKAAKLAAALGGDKADESDDDYGGDDSVSPECVECFAKIRKALADEDDEAGAKALAAFFHEVDGDDGDEAPPKKPLAVIAISHKAD